MAFSCRTLWDHPTWSLSFLDVSISLSIGDVCCPAPWHYFFNSLCSLSRVSQNACAAATHDAPTSLPGLIHFSREFSFCSTDLTVFLILSWVHRSSLLVSQIRFRLSLVRFSTSSLYFSDILGLFLVSLFFSWHFTDTFILSINYFPTSFLSSISSLSISKMTLLKSLSSRPTNGLFSYAGSTDLFLPIISQALHHWVSYLPHLLHIHVCVCTLHIYIVDLYIYWSTNLLIYRYLLIYKSTDS